MTGAKTRELHILVVEDNPADADLTREAFGELEIPELTVHVAWDGLDALDFLRHEGRHRDSPVPSLVLLDLNLPKIDGRKVLEEIKTDEVLRRIPVVVLSSSGAPGDVADSYNLHANSYVRKPVDYDEFLAIVLAIASFWLQVAQPPQEVR